MIDPGPFADALARHPRWNEFLAEYWLEQPFLFEGVLSEPFLSEPTLLHTYRCACEHAAGDSNVRFYALPRGGDTSEWRRLQSREAAPFLPEPADRSLTDYAARILESGEVGEFSAHLRYNMLRVGPESWWRARSLLTPLFEATGFPAGGWNLDCYAGRYRQTSFGVHTDLEDQLYLTPIGTKVMKLWHPRDWCAADDLETLRFHSERHPVAPYTFSVGPTDVLYWPQEFFHIGESPEFSLSVQINMRRLSPHTRMAGGEVITRSGYGPARPSRLRGERRLPAAIDADAGARPSPVLEGRGEALQYDVALHSAWFSTSEVPPVPFRMPLPPSSLDGGRLHVCRSFPILYGAADGSLILACNGEVWSMPDTVAGARLLDYLAPGTTWSVADLHTAINVDLPEYEQVELEALAGILAELAACGVIGPTEPEQHIRP